LHRGGKQFRVDPEEKKNCGVKIRGTRSLTVKVYNESETQAATRRIEVYDTVRIVLGLLLLTAAGLKGYQLATSPTPGTHLLNTRWFLILTVEYELLLGIWLLSGWRRRDAWRIALFSFAVFACVTLYKALSGEASCGCFGQIEVSPWITLVLDLAIVASLLIWWPATARVPLQANQQFKRLIATLALAALLGGPAGYLMANYTPAALADDGDIFGDSEFVVLEPETWVGKPFPLLNYIDIGDQLSAGEWVVVLYRHDCPHCVEELPKYERLARESADDPDAPRVALIEMPSYAPPSHDPVPIDTACVRGKLDDSREWFVQTPAEIRIKSMGRVISIESGEGWNR